MSDTRKAVGDIRIKLGNKGYVDLVVFDPEADEEFRGRETAASIHLRVRDQHFPNSHTAKTVDAAFDKAISLYENLISELRAVKAAYHPNAKWTKYVAVTSGQRYEVHEQPGLDLYDIRETGQAWEGQTITGSYLRAELELDKRIV